MACRTLKSVMLGSATEEVCVHEYIQLRVLQNNTYCISVAVVPLQ